MTSSFIGSLTIHFKDSKSPTHESFKNSIIKETSYSLVGVDKGGDIIFGNGRMLNATINRFLVGAQNVMTICHNYYLL